ncbi:VOC family protein [Kribbella sp. NPDC026611]|uniref:VOC family protein n=1 Tax=Kribbella sp. NPDC026611 TaxID=3154911 RepID=UPI00340CFDE2
MDDWRVVDGALSVWYDAPSHAAGAALVGRFSGLDAEVRARGVRVRIPGTRVEDGVVLARRVSEAAAELGLRADASALQTLRVAVEAAEPEVVRAWWGTVLGYEWIGLGGLDDALSRDPGVLVRRSTDSTRLRNRIHLDVGRPAEVVQQARATVGQEPYGVYGLTLADPEGNELDLVPGDELPGAGDWVAQFGAMTFYPGAAAEFVHAVAELADAAGIELLIDVRADGVAIDSGKDRWEDGEGDPVPAFVALAQEIQQAARGMGLTTAPDRLRFVQVAFDAVDIPKVQGFWLQALGYEHDPREYLADIYDPRWLSPVIMFQQLDAADARLHERSRMFLELAVPADQAAARIDTAVAAGGQILQNGEKRCLVADPEGNELAINWA